MQDCQGQTCAVSWSGSSVPWPIDLTRAAILCAVLAVVFQSLVNLAYDAAAWVLHVSAFCVVLLPALYLLRSVRRARTHQAGVRWDWSEQTITARAQAGPSVQRYRVIGVANYGLALVVTLQPIDQVWTAPDHEASTELTIWRWAMDDILYRKISLLAYWHIRGCA